MQSIKSYTDLEQSKRLVELLPFESADMTYLSEESLVPKVNYNGMVFFNSEEEKPSTIIPCWSLAALLDVLPTLDDRNANFCKDIRYDKWHVYYHSTATLSIIDTERYDNLIDACVAMIEKLHELKML